MIRKIAACVVLYHPEPQVVENIKSYSPFVDCLIAVDNSEEPAADWKYRLQSLAKNVIYLPQNKNTGIAKALNIAAAVAIENKYEWLLTMDQDSCFAEGSIAKMISDTYDIVNLFDKTGIITPCHMLSRYPMQAFNEKYTLINTAITSGNLVNLSAYETIGLFDENLFIDFVDHEYCLRMRKYNYKIVQNNQVYLNHVLGNFQIRHFLGKRIGISHHNYLRRYYMTRNGLYVARKYFKNDVRFFLRMLLDHYVQSPAYIALFEKDKLKKLKSIIKGTAHFVLGKTGSIAK